MTIVICDVLLIISYIPPLSAIMFTFHVTEIQERQKKNRYYFFQKFLRGNENLFFPHRSVSPKNHRRRQPGTLSTYEDRRHGRTKKKNVVSTGLRSIYVSCLVAHHQPACRPMQAPSKEKIFLYSVVYFPFSQ